MTQERYIEYSGSTLFYKVAGNGLPVILLHGFAEDHTIWNRLVNRLQNNYKCIIPDLPGTGRSTLPTKPGINMEDIAGCIKAVLSAENIMQCVMIGHSMGGYITLAFAEKFPDDLLGFGLFHSTAYADNLEKIETRKSGIAFIKKNGVDLFLKTSVPGLFYDQHKSRADIELLLHKGNNFTPEALIQYYEAMISRPDRTIILKNTALPVMMILGIHDKAVPLKQGLQQATMPAQTWIYLLRESAHMGMMEEGDLSNGMFLDFLQIFTSKAL